MSDHGYGEIREKMDEVSECELYAMVGYLTGVLTKPQAVATAHCSELIFDQRLKLMNEVARMLWDNERIIQESLR